MKNAIVFAFAILSLISNSQQLVKYSVEVTLSEASTNGKAYLRYFSQKGIHLDSAVIKDGKFDFHGILPSEMIQAKIWFLDKQNKARPENACEIFLESGLTKLISDTNLLNARFIGSKFQVEYSELQQSMIKVKAKQYAIDEEFRRAEESANASLRDRILIEEYPKLFIEKQQVLASFIQKNPASLVSAYKFEEFAGDEIDPAIVEPVYDRLSADIKKHQKVIEVAKRITIAKKTAVGMNAIEFVQTDTLGNKINLSSFRGKYVLVDFWASWCGPCRAETPRLAKLYDQYEESGFDIFSVSLDGDRKPWVKAIIKDNMTWHHGSDLKIFKNAAAMAYGITSIPQNILIDPNGKIIAKNLQGSNLERKLTDIFK